mmetsp:Transcript_21622/g.64476  ORF Transcript_21622/g.64476 Transcript_21622/m.64476 type:complete len:970 (-) Transcript_21622:221-3130(-)
MWFKRARHFVRHKKTVIAQVVVPSLFMLLALVIARYATQGVDNTEPCRTFDTTSYDNNLIYVTADNTGFDTQNAGVEYYNSTAVMGALGPTDTQRAYATSASALAISSSLFSTSAPLRFSDQNMTQFLLNRANNFQETEFFRKNVLSSSFIPGAIWLDDSCNVRVGNNYVSQGAINVAAGAAYVFQRVATDFNNVGSSDTFSVQCPVACNNTGGTTKNFCDFNRTGTSFAPANEWESQCGNNPLLQWVEIIPTTAEIGQSYTISCTGVSTLTATVVSSSDTSRFNTSAIVALAWYNRQAYHAAPESLNFADITIARKHLSDATVQIVTSNCPLPKTNQQLADDEAANDLSLSLGINVGMALAFLAGSFALFPVNERNQHAKHIQLVSGLDVRTYWLTAFVWDYITSLGPYVVFIILFAVFGLSEFEGSNLGIVFFLFLLSGWAIIPCVYCLTFFFKTSAGAYTIIVVLFFFTNLVMVIVSFILPILNDGEYRKNGIAELVARIFLINPVFAVAQGVSNVYQNYRFLDLCSDREQFCDDSGYEPRSNYFALDGLGVGANCSALAAEGVFFTACLLFIEYAKTRGRARRAKSAPTAANEMEDTDVVDERRRVLGGQAEHDGNAVVVKNLCRSFGSNIAVNQTTFGIPQGECFGLLGVNGAGKTTTFRMLTGELGISSGSAAIKGYDVATDLIKARKRMGYSPQYDGLIPHLTGRDHLTMFAMLRGMPPDTIADEVERAIFRLDLQQHCDRLAGTYSGGNKRKLSMAIALVGHPDVVFLDEPTTGVDPTARRKLWDVIEDVVKNEKTTVVMTSHSMDEISTLCSRLTIMVAGKLKCIGSTVHLKARFGQGYYVKAKTASRITTDQFLGALQNLAKREKVALVCEVLSQYNDTVNILVKETPGLSLGRLFRWMEQDDIRELIQEDKKTGARAYGVSQPDLEQIFLQFAHEGDAIERAQSSTGLATPPSPPPSR